MIIYLLITDIYCVLLFMIMDELIIQFDFGFEFDNIYEQGGFERKRTETVDKVLERHKLTV